SGIKIGRKDFWIEKRDSEGSQVWYKEFSGDDNSYIYSVNQTPGGEWVAASSTQLMKLDNEGNLLWNKPVKDVDYIASITQTPEGNLAIAGSSGSYMDRELWVAKYDSEGNSQWSKIFKGSTGYDYATSIIATADGGFAVAGAMLDGPAINVGKLWIIKLNSEGTLEWQKTFDKRSAGSIIQTMNGDFVVVTSRLTEGIVTEGTFFAFWGASKGAISSAIEIIRLNSKGEATWDKTFSRNQFDYGASVIETSDKNLIVTVLTERTIYNNSVGGKAWVIQLSNQGKMLWNEVFEENGANNGIFSVIETADKYLVGAGYIESEGIQKARIIKFKHVEPSLPELSVTTAFHNVSATSGISTFDVINTGADTMDWTAVSDVPWLSIKSGSPCTNSGVVIFSYDANSGDERIGTIKVTAPGAERSPQTVTIRQAKASKPILTLPSDIRACPPAASVSIPLTLNDATRDDLIYESMGTNADSVALSDIRNAYWAAQTFFSDYPLEALTDEGLKKAGYTLSEGVTLTLVSGTEFSNLSITSSHVNGNNIYSVGSNGVVRFESKSGDDLGLISKVEIAPRMMDNIAESDTKNAYTAAQAFFADYPTEELTYEKLKNSGYNPRIDVTLTIKSGTLMNLAMELSHVNGTLIYSVNWAGEITSSPKNVFSKVFSNVPIDVFEMKVEFDNTVLKAAGATLAGGVLENKNYEISYRTGDGYIVILIYAKDYEALFKGSGVIAYLNFDVIRNGRTATELTFVKSRINNRYVDTNIGSVEVGCETASQTLNVTKEGSGTGTVSSDSAGINCGDDCSENYFAGTAVTLTAEPENECSAFGGWTGCDSVADAECTVTMDAAKTVTAAFSQKAYNVHVARFTADDPDFPVDANDFLTFCGNTWSFEMPGLEGYRLQDVILDGASVEPVASYTLENVTSDHWMWWIFAFDNYSIAATAGPGGTISPDGNVTVNSGAEQIFTISPDTGYKVQDVLVDGVSVGSVAAYTFADVQSEHTIEVTFSSQSEQSACGGVTDGLVACYPFDGNADEGMGIMARRREA
ncbi:MAG: hypothetical protein BWK80_62215, partial [Desulfobacteraceae bacterium IS3]